MRYIKKIAVTSMETTGRILDSMNPEAGNPVLNAPSIHAVRQFLSAKIKDALSSEDERHEAPSIRAVNEALGQINSDINHFSGEGSAFTLTRATILTMGLERGSYLMAVRCNCYSSSYYQEPTTGTFRKIFIDRNASSFKELGSAVTNENEVTTISATFILELSEDSTFTFDLYHDNGHPVECKVEVDSMRLK
jgi:hypothetical protein